MRCEQLHIASVAHSDGICQHEWSRELEQHDEAAMRLGTQGGFTSRIARIERDLIALLSLVGAGFGGLPFGGPHRHAARRLSPASRFSAGIRIVAASRGDEAEKPVRAFLDICAAAKCTLGSTGLEAHGRALRASTRPPRTVGRRRARR